MFPAITSAKAIFVAVIFAVGLGAGGFGAKKWYGAEIATLQGEKRDLTRDRDEARRNAVQQAAVRAAVEEFCAASNGANSLASDLANVGRRAIENATRELDNATADDADPLRALYERVRVLPPEGRSPAAGADRGAPSPAREPNPVR